MFDYTNRVQHDPENGQYGDCFRIALAYMLRLDPDTVPHFCESGMEGSLDRANVWLSARGLSLVGVPYDADVDAMIESTSAHSKQNWPNVDYLIVGRSRTGCNHNVVYRNGEVVCDPVPGAGIVGPCEDGYTWMEFLVPVAGTLNKLDRLRTGIEAEIAHHERMAEEAGECEREHEAHTASRNAARLRALLEPQA